MQVDLGRMPRSLFWDCPAILDLGAYLTEADSVSIVVDNDGDLVRRWCVAGRGLAVKSCLDMSADLLTGKVISVMPGFKPRSTELWLICPSRQSITPAVRLLRDNFRVKCTVILNQLTGNGILEPIEETT